MADYLLEQECYDFFAHDDGDFQELTWNTKDEGAIAVSEMKDSHIKNCIAMLARRKQDADFWIAAFEDELKSRKV